MAPEVDMRRLLALLVLVAVAAPSMAGGWYRTQRVRGFRSHRFGWSRYDPGDPHGIHARVARFHRFFGHSARPYWHHPYYLRRFGGFRPYAYYRGLGYGWAGCGQRWGGGYGYGYGYGHGYGYNLYYPPAVAIAPIYSRLSVVLTLDDAAFSGPPADHDGLPRSREGLVGKRFLVDLE
jgi:hypothetical protein